ncbi:hypothetical protein G6F59_006647 [Rhizopus arrhizus]|nr:hypothetical protein G6F23_009521 [Rhizopus arrhizus]KAG1421555.1 hypothetical protein G6F59_006647 [Rhizopus arrhizus]
MNTSSEFTQLYNSIDWSKAPNVPVRKLNAAGGLDLAGYDTVNDPACWWSATQCTKPKSQNTNADIVNCPEPETWGLTFDDGPNCSHNAFYDYLQQNNQKASMFYIGSNVLNWPYGALRGLKDGHHLCGHTWSHKMMTTLNNQEVLAELYYTAKAIKYVTGVTPLYWRPALGDLDDRVRWIATQLNMTAMLWNLDTNDWAAGTTPGITADTVNQKYLDYIQMGRNGTFQSKGNIVLSHEINNMTMDFFMKHYPDIKKSYKHVTDVATCMNISNPYFEKVITFANFEVSTTKNISSVTGSGVVPGASGSPISDASTYIPQWKRSLTTKVDKHCLPLKPTWSIKSLMKPLGEPISDKEFKHLLNLARLNISKEKEVQLKSEIDQLTQFTEHIKLHDFKDVQPLTHIWKQDVGLLLRDDNKIGQDKVKGRELLLKAAKKSGNFYVVKGSMPNSE